MSHLTYAEAVVVGLIQGVTELFPVSSLGHNVLIPALVGGAWAKDLNVSAPESPYLAVIVGLHVATALGMIAYFWRDWLRILGGFASSVRERRVETADQRLAWLIILATIPVGIAGLALEHLFRVVFSKPIPTAAFLALNGVILLAGERLRRRSAAPPAARPVAREQAMAVGAARHPAPAPAYPARAESYPPHAAPLAPPQAARRHETELAVAADSRLAGMGIVRAVLIGATQVFALLPGISRDGVVTVAGMFRGLSREDAVRYSFLLSAPVILAAGVLKIPDLSGPLGKGIGGQVLVASLLSGIGAYFSIRFLVRYFSKSRTLIPFAIYCLAAGLGSLLYLSLR